MLSENGVSYTFDRQEGEELGLLWLPYKWRNHTRNMGGTSWVYVHSQADLEKLVLHWNSRNPEVWSYYL